MIINKQFIHIGHEYNIHLNNLFIRILVLRILFSIVVCSKTIYTGFKNI